MPPTSYRQHWSWKIEKLSEFWFGEPLDGNCLAPTCRPGDIPHNCAVIACNFLSLLQKKKKKTESETKGMFYTRITWHFNQSTLRTSRRITDAMFRIRTLDWLAASEDSNYHYEHGSISLQSALPQNSHESSADSAKLGIEETIWKL